MSRIRHDDELAEEYMLATGGVEIHDEGQAVVRVGMHERLKQLVGDVTDPQRMPSGIQMLSRDGFGSLGKAVQVGGNGGRATVIKVASNDERTCEVMAVTLIAPAPIGGSNLPVGPGVNYQALVNFGVDGIQGSFLCDYLSGCGFSLPCSSLEVIAINNGSTQSQPFGAFVAYKTVGNPLPPQLTTIVPVVAFGGTSVNVTIPAFAKRFKIMRDLLPNGGAFTLQMLDSSTLIVSQIQVGAFQPSPWIPIHNFCYQVNIVNNDPATNIAYFVVWELSL